MSNFRITTKRDDYFSLKVTATLPAFATQAVSNEAYPACKEWVEERVRRELIAVILEEPEVAAEVQHRIDQAVDEERYRIMTARPPLSWFPS